MIVLAWKKLTLVDAWQLYGFRNKMPSLGSILCGPSHTTANHRPHSTFFLHLLTSAEPTKRANGGGTTTRLLHQGKRSAYNRPDSVDCSDEGPASASPLLHLSIAKGATSRPLKMMRKSGFPVPRLFGRSRLGCISTIDSLGSLTVTLLRCEWGTEVRGLHISWNEILHLSLEETLRQGVVSRVNAVFAGDIHHGQIGGALHIHIQYATSADERHDLSDPLRTPRSPTPNYAMVSLRRTLAAFPSFHQHSISLPKNDL